MTFDIDKLQRKRQKNVQEQNFLRESEMFSDAKWFRENSHKELPIICSFLTSKSIDISSSLILHSDMSSYEDGDYHSGIILTQEGLFYKYDLELNNDRTEVIYEEWADVTEQYPIAEHSRNRENFWVALCFKS